MLDYYNTSQLFVMADLQARPETRIYPAFKRVAETIFSLILLILSFPLFLGIALAIRRNSPGPVLFRQIRIGKNGKPFTFYKFRSMYHDIDRASHETFMKAFVQGSGYEGAQAIFKPIQTNQITPVGRILRKTSLDELPQLFNVIKGEMSFVGPRPNVPAEVEAYQDWHARRLEVLPGITGLAQINGRSSISFDQIVKYDLEYIEKESFIVDLKILLGTIPAVLRGHGVK